MSAPLSVQLYSVRDALEKDFEATIRCLANIGYAGVETAGGPYMNEQAAETLRLFQEFGTWIPLLHVKDGPAKMDEAIDKSFQYLTQEGLGHGR